MIIELVEELDRCDTDQKFTVEIKSNIGFLGEKTFYLQLSRKN